MVRPVKSTSSTSTTVRPLRSTGISVAASGSTGRSPIVVAVEGHVEGAHRPPRGRVTSPMTWASREAIHTPPVCKPDQDQVGRIRGCAR